MKTIRNIFIGIIVIVVLLALMGFSLIKVEQKIHMNTVQSMLESREAVAIHITPIRSGREYRTSNQEAIDALVQLLNEFDGQPRSALNTPEEGFIYATGTINYSGSYINIEMWGNNLLTYEYYDGSRINRVNLSGSWSMFEDERLLILEKIAVTAMENE
jgi:hypothetical protein